MDWHPFRVPRPNLSAVARMAKAERVPHPNGVQFVSQGRNPWKRKGRQSCLDRDDHQKNIEFSTKAVD